MITYKKNKLSNGMRVVTVPLHETQAVTALLLVKVGSRYETRELNGISHFIEHLMFKGTEKRPSTLEISRELDGVGADYNAFTSKDHTGYYIKLNSEKLPLALDILSDMVFQSLYDPKEIERERGVIVEEINMYEDNPMMYTEDLFEETVFGDTPLGWKIAGPRENIRKTNREKILRLRDAYHVPSNMILVIAGRFSKNISSLIERTFAVPRQPMHGKRFITYSGIQRAPRVTIHYKDTHQVQMALGVPAYHHEHPKLYASHLLSVILGGNMSSRLFISIRERQGLCYFVRSSVNTYEDAGTFMIQAGIERKRIHEAITAILQELSLIAKKGVTADELAKAKEFTRGKLILGLEDSENIASWAGKQLLFKNKILTPEVQLKKIDRVAADEVKEVARKLFVTAKLNLALIGPYRKAGEFRKLLRMP
ncbi:MAG: pitrilysin family protein [Patescibacteria group bacterium]|jgi:predicted Zn-dependent peptidase